MAFQGDSIFWVDTEKVVPNPFQPRREFDQSKLQELSESIRMYGVLQPLTVTRSEVQRDDGTFYTEYELIAGERRLRASRLAGVAQVPVIIREGEQNEQEKLELAIIENLQREDLNAIDRALAFQQLAEQFGLSHTQVAQKVQRSREYVSNSIRLLALPEHMRLALQRGELGEGHARTLLMLNDKPEEQETIFREILLKKMSVREVERIVRKIATDKVRKKNHEDIGDHLIEIEKEFTETLGTRVQIQKTDFGGKLTIDYFSEDDLAAILKRMQAEVTPNQTVQSSATAAMAAVAAATPLMQAPDVAPAPEQESAGHLVQPVPQQSAAPMLQAEPDREEVPAEQPDPVATPPVPQPQSVPEPAAPVYSIPTTQPAPMVDAQPTSAPAPEQPATPAPTADPSLLERLSAHAPFGFSRPAPAPQDVPVQPSVVAHSTPPQPSPVAPPSYHNPHHNEEATAPVVSPEPQPMPDASAPHLSVEAAPSTAPDVSNHVSPEPEPPVQPQSVQAPPEPKPEKDESEDIYSIRNFSI